MNPYKMKAIMDLIRSHGGLPTDQFGNTRPLEEILAWYGLTDLLSPDEQRAIKRELAAMAEARIVIDQLKANMS